MRRPLVPLVNIAAYKIVPWLFEWCSHYALLDIWDPFILENSLSTDKVWEETNENAKWKNFMRSNATYWPGKSSPSLFKSHQGGHHWTRGKKACLKIGNRLYHYVISPFFATKIKTFPFVEWNYPTQKENSFPHLVFSNVKMMAKRVHWD